MYKVTKQLEQIRIEKRNVEYDREKYVQRLMANGIGRVEAENIYRMRAEIPIGGEVDKVEKEGSPFGLSLMQIVEYNEPFHIERNRRGIEEEEKRLRGSFRYKLEVVLANFFGDSSYSPENV